MVRFASPDGKLRGPATVKLSSDGDVSIQIEVQETDIPEEFGNTPGSHVTSQLMTVIIERFG